ncbi:MAG: malonyl-ACP O-methyltransferase BioC [Methylococcaceae bacterium]|nr:malonyl-ACP O-methyltransferase BioC [Methylococcaceae bacterium]
MFNPDKVKIRQSFAAASITYDGAAELQRTVGKALLAGVSAETLSGRLMDLGCGTGFLTAELLSDNPRQSMIAVDIAMGMLNATRGKLINHNNVSYVCADAELLPVAASTLDGVVSNLALQWCRNLEAVFADLKRVIKPGGQLVFSTFGPQTLQELKAAWAEVDDYSHVNEFYDVKELEVFLRQAGFRQLQIESRTYVSSYDSVLDLMHELQAIGAQNVIGERSKTITTKLQLQKMITAYETRRVNSKIPATYECLFVQARA